MVARPPQRCAAAGFLGIRPARTDCAADAASGPLALAMDSIMPSGIET
jgi:hypothetical protein